MMHQKHLTGIRSPLPNHNHGKIINQTQWDVNRVLNYLQSEDNWKCIRAAETYIEWNLFFRQKRNASQKGTVKILQNCYVAQGKLKSTIHPQDPQEN